MGFLFQRRRVFPSSLPFGIMFDDGGPILVFSPPYLVLISKLLSFPSFCWWVPKSLQSERIEIVSGLTDFCSY